MSAFDSSASKTIDLRAMRLGDVFAREAESVFHSESSEHPLVVESQIAREVVGSRQLDSERDEHLLIRPQVKDFGVGEHPVEVEDDRGDHELDQWPAAPSRSPARIGMAKRFSRGGTGQS